MTYVELEPDEHQHVQVRLDDGIWVDGTLETFRKVEGVWSGLVRFALTADDTRVEWFEEGRIRGARMG
jgi:hypothetical protein